MKSKGRTDFDGLNLALHYFFIYFYFLSGLSLLFFLLSRLAPWSWLNYKAPLNSFLNWASIKCSWQCLGPSLSGLFLESGFKVVIFSFLVFVFLRALWIAAKAIRSTNSCRRRLEAKASAKKRWGIDYYLIPLSMPLAFTVGWLKPRIFISSSLETSLEEEELKTILFHEARHQRRKDPSRSLLIAFLSDLLFFLPLTKRMRRSFGLYIEIEADLSSLKAGQTRKALMAALAKMHRYPFAREINSAWFSDTYNRDLDRLRYLSEGKLTPFISWRPLLMTVVLAMSMTLFGLITLFPRQREAFLAHQSSCSGHINIINKVNSRPNNLNLHNP